MGYFQNSWLLKEFYLYFTPLLQPMKTPFNTFLLAAAVALASTSCNPVTKEADNAAGQTEANAESTSDAAATGADAARTTAIDTSEQVSQSLENAAERASATTSSSTSVPKPDPEVGTTGTAPNNK